MNSYQTFIFKDYQFDAQQKRLTLNYSFDDQLDFEEVFDFDFPYDSYDESQLDRAMQHLFFMAGVSYYKAYLPEQIVIQKGSLDEQTAEFFSSTYKRGLGEFFYVNSLSPDTPIIFPVNSKALQPIKSDVKEGLLIGLGGGKDSILSVELLRHEDRVATWSLGHETQLEPLVKTIDLPHFSVKRQWDKKLTELNEAGAYNGHVPISAIFATVGTILNILTGYRSAVVSNENSANEATLQYRGHAINHQYSKSLEFERSYQALLRHSFGESTEYYSFLRPLSELRIAEMFADKCFYKYKDVFSSCNRAFTSSSDAMSWCGNCPKCAFVFMALTPFTSRLSLEKLWNGKNLLFDPTLEPIYKQLLGIEGDKPLDCVGEIRESREAMHLSQQIYPELSAYNYNLDPGYNYLDLYEHSMPPAIYRILLNSLH